MNLAKWTFLFLSTVGLGIVTSLLIGTVVFFLELDVPIAELSGGNIVFNLLTTVTVGSLLGAFSHLGFFAYLTLNYFAQGIFKTRLLWSYVQVFLIIVVSVYSAVFRMPEGGSVLPYTVLPILLFLAALPVAWRKVKETNQHSFIPTLFFLTAVTLLEAVPALHQYNALATILMVAPLFVCNAWQILRLHRLLAPAQTKEPAGRA
ncbi:KinB-signaling pathway activation protein [Paenibacillus sp. TRM 82003]|nr:KinB-signaling pathway activation protein [Paenibacillus sp. TRM 82003]